MPFTDAANIWQTLGIIGATVGDKKCTLVSGSSYRIQAIARGPFIGIIAPGWNKSQILVKRSKYSPFCGKGRVGRAFCNCIGGVSESASENATWAFCSQIT